MERRDFMKICAAGAMLAAGNPVASAGANAAPRFYSRVLLVDESGQPVRTSNLIPNRSYLFHYPYAGTPCFLLNLGKPAGPEVILKTADGSEYVWEGGVGAKRSIVAYSAICAHRMAYPTRQITFISYYRDRANASRTARANMIHCCAEHSEYDPASGARVVGGPAKQPLAAILLDYQPDVDELYAVGTLGGELFNEFFKKYDFKLALDYGSNKAKSPVTTSTVVSELSSFCRQEIRC